MSAAGKTPVPPSPRPDDWLPIILAHDLDAWPCKEHAGRALDSVVAVQMAGFLGARFNRLGKAPGPRFYFPEFDEDRPEARILQTVMALAMNGVSMPPETVLAVIRQTYREEGLKLPHGQEHLP